VAAGLALGALGSDTGGSIRLPAACCGVVGMKPTWGRVSRAGAMPLSWSMDHLGPLTRTVRDSALMLQAIAGYDRNDATTSHHPVPEYLAGLEGGVSGVRLGVPTDFFWEELDREMERAVRAALETLRDLGASIEEVALPEADLLSDLSNVVARSESAAIHHQVAKERPDDLQPAVRTRLLVGYGLSAVDYLQAQRLRAKLTREVTRRVFGQVDVLIAPVIPRPAPPLVEVKAGDGEAIAERMGRFSRLTRPFNALGLPAMSMPAGFSREGLPLAFQLAGRPFAEAIVLRVGRAYEAATDWHNRRPPG
jgi:aspartyl-tRNA(Asn)/glutamyl-tRNA(Gln) amidotransferase subunit A